MFSLAQSHVGRAISTSFLLSSTTPVPAGPNPEPGSRLSLQYCLLPACQFPLGMLCALCCQHLRHDDSLMPGERGPHVPHMPLGWKVWTQYLSGSLLLLPGWRLPSSSLCPFQGTFHSDQAGDTMWGQVMAHSHSMPANTVSTHNPAQEPS